MSKRFLLILLILVAVFGGFVVASKKQNKTNGSNTAQLSNHVEGASPKGITLTEYGDYQCPACLGFYPSLKQIAETYKDRVVFQFRNYPLSEIHQNAIAAARAAEAAGLQNKYWEMHDLLYDNQKSWSESSSPTSFFEQYATQLNLDVAKFKADSNSEAVNNVIQADRGNAKGKGYNATPTFELNGQEVKDPVNSVEFFTKLLDDALNK